MLNLQLIETQDVTDQVRLWNSEIFRATPCQHIVPEHMLILNWMRLARACSLIDWPKKDIPVPIKSLCSEDDGAGIKSNASA